MDDSVPLLDTPKKNNLQSQAETLRIALKDYERTFAVEHNGRKPSRDEIKANTVVAAQYQRYQSVRDVLAGKRGLDALKTPKRQQSRRTRERTDSGISLTPHRPRHFGNTPSRSQKHPNDIDPYDPPSSASPRVLPTAIGPTPRRDGMVLGIFDLLSNSGSGRSSQATPSSRKRKIDALYDATGGETREAAIAQTPSQKRRQSAQDGNQCQITATPGSRLATGKRNHSKTPISESKKFMLNHFFATPSAVRFAGMMGGDDGTHSPAQSKTPLRDLVLGITPVKEKDTGPQNLVNADATPPYLKRSFSFKERLLSASGESKPSSSTTRRSLSGSLRHARFAPKPLSQIIADRQQAQAQAQEQEQAKARQQQRPQYPNENDDDDDLDALREMEAGEMNVLVEDSQIMDESGQVLEEQQAEAETEQPTRVWKKKGQKRTTRRVIMRPVRMKPAPKSKLVVGDEDDEPGEQAKDLDEDEFGDVSRVEETQFLESPELDEYEDEGPDPDIEYLDEDAERERNYAHNDGEADVIPDEAQSARKAASNRKTKSKSKAAGTTTKTSKSTARDLDKSLGKPAKAKEKDTTRTINPNAVSHMNFRSLKIKNKNSKAKGRGRFGKGRR